jgi:hypothetical protein
MVNLRYHASVRVSIYNSSAHLLGGSLVLPYKALPALSSSIPFDVISLVFVCGHQVSIRYLNRHDTVALENSYLSSLHLTKFV